MAYVHSVGGQRGTGRGSVSSWEKCKVCIRRSLWSCPLAGMGWTLGHSPCFTFEAFSLALPDFQAIETYGIPFLGIQNPVEQSARCMGCIWRVRGPPSPASSFTGRSPMCTWMCTRTESRGRGYRGPRKRGPRFCHPFVRKPCMHSRKPALGLAPGLYIDRLLLKEE